MLDGLECLGGLLAIVLLGIGEVKQVKGVLLLLLFRVLFLFVTLLGGLPLQLFLKHSLNISEGLSGA